jgi:heat shock protein HslJ
MKTIIWSVLLALGMSACTSTSGSSGVIAKDHPLSGPTWILQTIGDKSPIGDQALSFRLLSDGQIRGASGCGDFFGMWLKNKPEAPILMISADTQITNCPSDIRAQEERYVLLLQLVKTYQAAGDTLTMTTSTGTSLRFRRATGN